MDRFKKGDCTMNYELRHKDSILLKFSATENSNEPEIEIFWQNTELQYLLPLDLTVSEGGLSKWLKHRTIPKNRAYVHSFLSKCGMNINRPMNIWNAAKVLAKNIRKDHAL